MAMSIYMKPKDGSRTHLWLDNRSSFPLLCNESQNYSKYVSTKKLGCLNSTFNKLAWALDYQKHKFKHSDFRIEMEVLNNVMRSTIIAWGNMADEIWWMQNPKGKFSVKSVYQALTEIGAENSITSHLVELFSSKKKKLNCLVFVHEGIQTKNQLVQRKVHLVKI